MGDAPLPVFTHLRYQAADDGFDYGQQPRITRETVTAHHRGDDGFIRGEAMHRHIGIRNRDKPRLRANCLFAGIKDALAVGGKGDGDEQVVRANIVEVLDGAVHIGRD
ncbi:hypothetical protein DKP76_07625 [Falsochrobactrum shanghaiense]|uniref:Uncharacterized protein n=1 Tax=Falsochrobactrum shanghaiense TaxID=2201899 RepID=A0A316JUR5_9HYPH|nr:hypothetical protein DKP76_07625 [Falsochrobactrum shanghaiense]